MVIEKKNVLKYVSKISYVFFPQLLFCFLFVNYKSGENQRKLSYIYISRLIFEAYNPIEKVKTTTNYTKCTLSRRDENAVKSKIVIYFRIDTTVPTSVLGYLIYQG